MWKKVLIICLLTLGVHAVPVYSEGVKEVTVGEVKANGVRHVNAAQASEVIKQAPEVIVLDVRTPFEYNRGRIEGAININYYSFSFKKQISKLDRSKTYLVHCQTGVRSGKSIPIMLEAGFTNLIHMDGGYRAWKETKLPVVK